MFKAHYDERNQLDYVAMTKKINDALETLEKNKSIPATEAQLVKLAGCSRGTLRNRFHPLIRLKEIKKARLNSAGKKKYFRLTAEQRVAVDVHIAEKKHLKRQIEASRNETAVWVKKFLDLEREIKKLERLVKILRKTNQTLESKLQSS